MLIDHPESLIAISSGSDDSTESASAGAAGIRYVDVDGQRLRVGVWPGDPARVPLLLFNGLGARLELLGPFAEALGGAVEVIAFDIPGVGESPAPLIPYRLWILARLASRLLDRLGYDRVDAMGVSWGGTLAQQFALQNPRRCRKLVLAATSHGMLMVPGSLSVLLKFADARRHNDPGFRKRNFGAMYGGAARTRPELADHVGQYMGGVSRRGYLLQQLAITGWTSLPWLRFLPQSTLVMAGDDDPIIPLINAKLMACLIPDARLHVLHDGHLFLMSSVAESVAAVLAFLDEE